ncbi:MAG: nucleotidyltransferase [Planctomycetaceae bacterium]|nr:nucleotidyltransferase [Planctomycetaceae bacterium]
MLVTASANHTLDTLLELLCIQLQLTKTQDSRVRDHYRAVTNWLAAEGSPLRGFSPHIFPQGSQRLGTTTKPVGHAEFDLDAVCKLILGPGCTPGELYSLIWDRLASNETYRKMMRRMPRCIRLDYAGDFHLDIAPAIPDETCGGNCILVPDLRADLSLLDPKNNSWKSTNPIDYAEWFEGKCVTAWVLEGNYARAQVDPVPETESIHAKPALKRSVQLFKRWRDVEYEQRPKLSPPSIILTTLSGHFYEGHQLCTDALQGILDTTVAELQATERLDLKNPAHPDEDICEKWDDVDGAYEDFCDSVVEFRDRFERLQSLRGLDVIQQELTELFGESPVESAIRSFVDQQISIPRTNGTLKMQSRSGLLVPATVSAPAISVRQNTFHGD